MTDTPAEAQPIRPTLANFEPCGVCADCRAGREDSACWHRHYQAAISAAMAVAIGRPWK